MSLYRCTLCNIVIGCQQYHTCRKGRCPVDIATQNPEFRARFKVDKSAKRLENYLRVTNDELKDFARLTGNDSEISGHAPIEHV